MGNRVKGRVKKKSIKAASHSGMGSKRKLSRMGKKQKKNHSGLDATFIGRSKCLKKLQISLKDFRRLCILKGVYPREPRGRTPSKKKGQVYYHMKDVRALAHEPLLEKFREFRAFMRKVRKAAGRNEKDEAARKETFAPTYSLHHLVRERYPRFVDALSDLDDALALIYLFAALPSKGRVAAKITKKAQSLAAQWGAYCATTSSITKSFISVKGVYMEASIQNCTVRWIVPHSFTQNIPTDVDFRVMTTFFEFYETLLAFVLYKLYNDIGVRYPLPVTDVDVSDCSSVLAANLNVLGKVLRDGTGQGSASNAIMEAVGQQTTETENENEKKTPDKKEQELSEKKRELLKSVDAALMKVDDDDEEEDMDDDEDDVDISAPLKAALESMTEEEGAQLGTEQGSNISKTLDKEASKRKGLFSGLTFFLSREIPKGYIELVCLAFGGKVGWDGKDSPISMKDPSITHHLVDRPKLPASLESLPKSREFIQPQWLLDCANSHFLLPTSKYAVGADLPPHLSPWVDNEEEGYKPAYAEEIENLKNGIIAPETTSIVSEEKKQTNSNSDDVSEKESESESSASEDNEGKSEEEEEEEEEEEDKMDAKKQEKLEAMKAQEEDEAKALAKGMMSKKASRLYGRMQHGLAKKQDKIEDLQRKRHAIDEKKRKKSHLTLTEREATIDSLYRERKPIEQDKGRTLDGKTILKAKVDRLKGERKLIENDYKNTGGSMKKKRRKQMKRI